MPPFDDVGTTRTGGFFNPDRRDLGGTIGNLLGLPTAAERQADTEGRVLSGLSKLHPQSGNDPRKTIINFLNSPEGQDLVRQPGAADIVKKWTDTITNPKSPDQVGPGTTALDPYTQKPIASVPTAENQYVDHMVEEVMRNPGSFK